METARAAGVEITAHRDGSLEVTPASKLPYGLGDAIRELREPIAAYLRNDTLTIPAPGRAA